MLENRRRRAMALLKAGLNLSEVAAKVGCSVSSVFLWREAFRKAGEKGLRAKPVSGRPPKLNLRQKRSLTGILLRGAAKSGYSTDLWTTRRVADVVGKRFGVDYHPNHLWRILDSLGWSCQKPEKRARERAEKDIAHWKRSGWAPINEGQNTWGPPGVPP